MLRRELRESSVSFVLHGEPRKSRIRLLRSSSDNSLAWVKDNCHQSEDLVDLRH